MGVICLDVISEGRIFLGSECFGDKICCACGLKRAKKSMQEVIKPTFTDLSQLIKHPSLYMCDSCEKLYTDKNMRFKLIYSDKRGTYKVINRQDVLDILCKPPDKFVLSVPYSFKKHHWLYAGMSDRHKAYIGTDDRTIIVDYDKYNIQALIKNVVDCVNCGISKKEIITGKYSTFTYVKFPFIDKIETELFLQVRQSGLLELITYCAPIPKVKTEYKKEGENLLLTRVEINAVNLLGAIAAGSQYRRERGLDFWGGYFERRINKFKNLDGHEFVSRLAESVSSNWDCGYQDMIKNFEESEINDIMECIRSKTHLMVAIAYSERKKD